MTLSPFPPLSDPLPPFDTPPIGPHSRVFVCHILPGVSEIHHSEHASWWRTPASTAHSRVHGSGITQLFYVHTVHCFVFLQYSVYYHLCVFYSVCYITCWQCYGTGLSMQVSNMPLGAVAAYLAVRGRSLGPWCVPVSWGQCCTYPALKWKVLTISIEASLIKTLGWVLMGLARYSSLSS